MKQKSIKINFLMNVILKMSSFIFPLISFPYVSRILLPMGTGKVALATSIISYFLIFSQLGIPTYGIRACAKVRDDREELSRTAQELLIINLITSIISYIVLFILVIYVPKMHEDKLLYIIMSLTIILSAIGMEWLYQALEEYTYIAIRSVIFKLIALVAMFLLIHQQSDYIVYGAITILASSASNIFNFINVHKYINLKPISNYNFKRHIKPVCIFFAMACATTIYTNLDNVMLGFIASDTDVGYYNAAVKVKTILVSIVTALGGVLLPRATYYIENGMVKDFKRIAQKAISFVFIFASPLMVYFTLFAKEGIYFLSGEAYSGAIVPMQIIMPTLLFIGITNVLGIQILVPMGREKVVLFSEIVGGIVDIIINIILIPKYAASGAAVGTLAAECIVFLCQYYVLKNEMNYVFKNIHYFRIFIGIIIGTISSIWIKILGVGIFVSLIVSAILFMGTYGIYLLLRREELIIDCWNLIVSKVKRN